jgi:hypothetical protein
VPNPGRCFKGSHRRRTNAEITNVEAPIFSGELSEIPSASTVQGELPRLVTIKKASPIPKIVNPKINIDIRCRCCFCKPIAQVDSARHGVMGIVLEGLKTLISVPNLLLPLDDSLTAKL